MVRAEAPSEVCQEPGTAKGARFKRYGVGVAGISGSGTGVGSGVAVGTGVGSGSGGGMGVGVAKISRGLGLARTSRSVLRGSRPTPTCQASTHRESTAPAGEVA
jgi:hypothetical protein